jgi:hypothetical protein
VAPGGEARLISMSRDGPASPVPRPASATRAIAAINGSGSTATASSKAPDAAIAPAIVTSSRLTRPATKPPITMPTAPQTM